MVYFRASEPFQVEIILPSMTLPAVRIGFEDRPGTLLSTDRSIMLASFYPVMNDELGLDYLVSQISLSRGVR